MSYSEADTNLIEQAVQRGAITVKLDGQFEIQFGMGMNGVGMKSGQVHEHPAVQVGSSTPFQTLVH